METHEKTFKTMSFHNLQTMFSISSDKEFDQTLFYLDGSNRPMKSLRGVIPLFESPRKLYLTICPTKNPDRLEQNYNSCNVG